MDSDNLGWSFFNCILVIITDCKPSYHELIKDKLGIEQQKCIIHLKKAINRKIRKELNKIKNKIKGSILNETPNISDESLYNQTEELMKPVYKEYKFYKKAIFKAFECESFKESTEYIQSLRKEVKQ